MELRQLKYFVTTADLLSFSEAARKLYISQSTLSQQIRTLEDELGSPLFERTTHKVILTEAGARMLPMARETLKSADACKSQVRDLNDMVSGTLTIGVTRFIRPVFAETARKFMKMYPGVRLRIFYAGRLELLPMLRKREIDFALTFMPDVTYDDIDSELLFDDRLSVVMRKDNPLAGREKLTLEDLAGRKFVLPAEGLPARTMLERYLDVHHNALDVRVEVNAPSIIMDFVEIYNYITVLSSSITRYYPNLTAIELDVPDNVLHGCVHTLKNSYRKRSEELFLELLRHSDEIREMNRSMHARP